jgi:sulfotransferase
VHEQSWSTLREAFSAEHSSRLIVVPYERVSRAPIEGLAKLYAEVHEAPFDHYIENVEYAEPEFDNPLGLPGLHSVRSKVDYQG